MLGISLVHAIVRRTWLVASVAVLVCSVFAAHAVAALVETQALMPDAKSPPPVLVAKPAAPGAPILAPLDGSAFVARNMFCSDCTPAETGPIATGIYAGKPAILIATAIGKEPRATVRVPETEVQGDWGMGDRIPGVGTIDRIGPVSIDVVDTTGGRATLRLLEAPPPDRSAGAATPARDPAPADPFADSIKKIDDKTYEVRRDLVRELVSGAQKPGKVRMMPIVNKDGEVGGVRVYGVTAGSLPAALGMKSSDVIDSINGEPIKNAQQLLDLYAKLDKLDTVELGGKRGGKPLGIELRLR